jgi:transcriptional regulator with XRE-family HTH domain
MLHTIVQQRRLALQKTQQQIAEAAECSPEMISMIERGRRSPDLDAAQQLADALGLDRAYLIKIVLKRQNPEAFKILFGD